VRVDLDGTGASKIATGVGFFDDTKGVPFVKARNGIELHPVLKISAVGNE
jgi:imidazoleglycerol phosphate dehydratase HisB